MWPASPPRVLFNADPNFLFANLFPPHAGKRKFDIQVIHDYVDMLAANGVDTVLICPNAQSPWYPSRQLPSVLAGYERGNLDFLNNHFPPLGDDFNREQRTRAATRIAATLDRFLDLQEAGIDWLEEMITHCRQRGMSPWVSVRMNDAHGSNNWAGSFLNPQPLRDPACRLSGKTGIGPGANERSQQLMNYSQPAVRDYMLTMIRELVTDYAFEGMELDWVRTAHCCEPPASEADISLMNRWHRQVRALSGAIPLGLRVPARVRTLRDIGIDVHQLAQQGVIDFVGPANFWQTTWDVSAADLKRDWPAGVAVIGVVDDAPNWLPVRTADGSRQGHRLLSASPEFLRGNAANKLAMGADAIEVYNFFCTDEPPTRNPDPLRRQACYDTLAELANLNSLRGKPKQYTLATGAGGYMYPAFESADQLPAMIQPGLRHALRLGLCQEPFSAGLELIVQLVFKRQASMSAGQWGVSLNGSWPTFDARESDALLFSCGQYTHHLPEHLAFNYTLKIRDILEGWNEVVITSVPDAPMAQLVSLELAVREICG